MPVQPQPRAAASQERIVQAAPSRASRILSSFRSSSTLALRPDISLPVSNKAPLRTSASTSSVSLQGNKAQPSSPDKGIQRAVSQNSRNSFSTAREEVQGDQLRSSVGSGTRTISGRAEELDGASSLPGAEPPTTSSKALDVLIGLPLSTPAKAISTLTGAWYHQTHLL